MITSDAHRRYLLLEQGLGSIVINVVLNAAIAWLLFRGLDVVPLWGNQSIAGDTIATTLIPPGPIPGYRSPIGLGYDPDRARADLAAAGWADRDGDGLVETADGWPFPVIDLLYTTNTPHVKS